MKPENKSKKAQGRVFEVTITETLKRTVRVYESELKEASVSDAEQTISDWWHNGQIILESDDFVDVSFSGREVCENAGT